MHAALICIQIYKIKKGPFPFIHHQQCLGNCTHGTPRSEAKLVLRFFLLQRAFQNRLPSLQKKPAA